QQGGGVGSDGSKWDQGGARSRGVVDDLAGRSRLHTATATWRAVSRRQRDDLARREGELRQDRGSAARDVVISQRSVPGGRGRGGAGSVHDPFPARVARSVVSHDAGLTV